MAVCHSLLVGRGTRTVRKVEGLISETVMRVDSDDDLCANACLSSTDKVTYSGEGNDCQNRWQYRNGA